MAAIEPSLDLKMAALLHGTEVTIGQQDSKGQIEVWNEEQFIKSPS
jgi:hypothetical protein